MRTKSSENEGLAFVILERQLPDRIHIATGQLFDRDPVPAGLVAEQLPVDPVHVLLQRVLAHRDVEVWNVVDFGSHSAGFNNFEL